MAIPHALDRLDAWLAARRAAGDLLLALDFDGTLAPIVPRPDAAAMPPTTHEALRRVLLRDDTTVAVVSGRSLDDVRARVGLEGVCYAGNHGMEIDGPGVHRVHEAARAARPALAECARALRRALAPWKGVEVEDKGLTLSVHYRRAADAGAATAVRAAVEEACRSRPLRWTSGKKVLEVRPDVDWDKGRAVRFLLDALAPAPGAPLPAVFIGDDRTDEDAFRALSEGDDGGAGTGSAAGASVGAARRRRASALREGVLVSERPPRSTAAASYVRSPAEVATLLARLA